MQRTLTSLIVLSIFTNIFAGISPAQSDERKEPEKGLIFSLRELPPREKPVRKDTKIDPLDAASANAIFDRLPPISFEDADVQDTSIRPASLPPPKAGTIVPIDFEPKNAETAPESRSSEKLEILRYAPSGLTTVTSDLSMTFSEPMVAVGSQSAAAQTVPVKLEPAANGRWRWLGTKTLIFDPERRFPMSTRFTVRIPAGTRSISGAKLENDVFWEFSTPTVSVRQFRPTDDQVRPNALMTAVFDQRIDPAKVLAKTTASANGTPIQLRLATPDEIRNDTQIAEFVKSQVSGQFMVFRAVERLPPDSRVVVEFGAGLPSEEGPLTSENAVRREFKTYGSFKFESSGCGWRESKSGKCKVYEDLSLRFSNTIDPETFDKSLVKVEPPIKDADFAIYGNRIDVENGARKAGAKYVVTVSGKLRDIFGQTLGGDVAREFTLEPADPQLFGEREQEGFATLDPKASPFYSVLSEGFKQLKVKVFAVSPNDFGAYVAYRADNESDGAPNIGKLVFEKRFKVGGKRGETRETKILLGPAMKNGLGHAIVVVEPDADSKTVDEQRIVIWLQSTRIAVDSFLDSGKIVAYASDLMTGKPLNGVGLTLATGGTATTAESGLATIEKPSENNAGDWIVARNSEDSAILLSDNGYRSEPDWKNLEAGDQLKWFVFDDRAMYRPGETVSIKGYVRRFTAGAAPDIAELRGAVESVDWILKDRLGNESARGTVPVKEFGAFDFSIKVPENTNLGRQNLSFKAASKLEGSEFTHSFRVEEFRRPEFEVKAKTDSPAPYFIGGSATVAVDAHYYSGGPLAAAESSWTVKSTPTTYTPPNRGDFTFGEFVPWWKYYSTGSQSTVTRTIGGKTGADGFQRIAIDFAGADEARPYSVTAEARVSDVNRQAFASTATLLVHPSDYYVGLRTARAFVLPNQSFELESIVTDIDGKAIAGVPVTILAELKDYEQIKGKWEDVTVSSETCEVRSTADAAKCSFNSERGGRFEFTATVADQNGRKNRTKMTVWVGGESREPVNTVTDEDLELIPAKKEFTAGEDAEILLNAPFYPAEAVMTVNRRGIVRTERLTIEGPSTVLKVPVEESFVPGFRVDVELFGSKKRIYFDDDRDKRLPDRPAYATGNVSIGVTKSTRQLQVTADARKKDLSPGGETEVEIVVKDEKGRPSTGTEVAVVAADESVLALTDYHVGDPTDSFYTGVYPNVESDLSRKSVILADPWEFLPESESKGQGSGLGFGYGSGMGSGSGDGDGYGLTSSMDRLTNPILIDGFTGGRIPRRDADSPFRRLEILNSLQRPPNAREIQIRRNFNALALFSPSVRTDADGRATIKLKLPDNLTRYRITAVAATESNKFGKSESTVTASQPLMIRPSAPRFMNFGDKAEIPVVVQNTTGETRSVDVAIRSTNARFTNGIGRRVEVPANDRVEVRFPVETEKAGFARFQIGGTSADLADAAEFAFPVLTPVTGESFATYGTTDKNGAFAIPIAAPKDVIPGFGGLEVTTSSTQLQELTDAFIYLQTYPFECSEQRSSRMLSTAALRDVLAAFNAKGLPPKEDLEDRMNNDIAKLVKLQHKDGGWSYWRSDDESVPYVSAHVTHALFEAKIKGFAVPEATFSKAAEYLEKVADQARLDRRKRVSVSVAAYAIYVRNVMGFRDLKKAKKLIDDYGVERFPLEAMGWILPTLAADKDSSGKVDEMLRILNGRVTEKSNAASFATSYDEDDRYYALASNRKTDGILLEALLKTRPPQFEALLSKIARGLLDGRVRGRWYNTQENAFALLALDRYFKAFEKEVPDFRARIWFGDSYAGEQTFRGRTTESKVFEIPMPKILEQKDSKLTVDRNGAGRLYYRIGMTYAPRETRQEAADYGFEVSREYEAVDDPSDVVRNADGSWEIRSGARVRVRLRMVTTSPRYHVALVDNLPAGFEIINPDLVVSERVPADPKSRNFRWYDHINLRDNRAELFKSLLSGGLREYSYVVRATTPGEFIAPPLKAEEMYSPETFGRSATEMVLVK